MSCISKLARLVLSLSLVAGSFVLMPKMQAQQGSITARVPFAFLAGDQRLDAGEYQITPLNPFVLVVYNVTTHQSRLLPVSSMGIRDIQSKGRLVFHRYNGNEHYLYQVWMPGRSDFSELSPTRRERQAMLASKSAPPSGNTVEALVTPVR
jgi:hypothetical protein